MSDNPSLPIRILVAEDHTVVRDGIVAILKQEPDMQIVGDTSDGQQAIELWQRHRPDICLMDLRMPIVNGVSAIERIRAIEPTANIIVTARRHAVATELNERLGVAATTDNLAAARAAEVVLVCVKPQRFAELFESDDMRSALAGKLVISIAAGITLDKLAKWLPDSAVIRAMPNTPAQIGQGMTVLCRFDVRKAPSPANVASDEQVALTHKIFESVGRCLEVESKLMDAVTSLNGSGPAFV